MEKARAILSVGEEESERVARLDVRPHRAGHAASFYEGFATRGLRVDCIRPGFISCTFKVPPRLTDAGGNLSPGAIANLVDEVAAAVIHSEGHHMKISVDMSISYMCAAKVDSLARSRCFHGCRHLDCPKNSSTLLVHPVFIPSLKSFHPLALQC
ncbi:uncharacterized protein LOC135581090 isoform X2 [Musa acuminata AAA Group]|uniref:uncharacterized protein LOC135581090 isoform X2 n=1 Tax=Musa acuminata AAA Group TaxID=214697 RepID=UPI0031E16BB8